MLVDARGVTATSDVIGFLWQEPPKAFKITVLKTSNATYMAAVDTGEATLISGAYVSDQSGRQFHGEGHLGFLWLNPSNTQATFVSMSTASSGQDAWFVLKAQCFKQD
ncbi:MAG: hypothetical protein VR74_20075 [Hyphomonas sp. BRH_c22]|nr:MAG: hypothetical protein VR74_20075 [Hyphomonas sp. BRH_c22]